MADLLVGQGHQLIRVNEASDCVQAFQSDRPDLLIMDLVLPGTSGLALALQIRKLSRFTPIVFFADAPSDALAERALDVGLDLIARPITPRALAVKLKALFRGVGLFRQVIAEREQMHHLHAQLVEENRVAAHVLSRMISRLLPPGEDLRYSVIPSGVFSGDIVLAGTTPSGKLHVLLGDAIGHGLPAAFSILPVVPIFEAMTRKGFPLEDILFQINRSLRHVMPIDRFIAATAICADFSSGNCEVWVGGNPAVKILTRHGILRVDSTHLALGLNDVEDKGEFACTTLSLDHDDRLVFFSDGLLEAWDGDISKSAGEFDEFLLATAPTEIFDKILAAARWHEREDDVSLVVLRMRKEVADLAVAVEAPVPHQPARVDLELGPKQLRNPDMPHIIIDIASDLGIVTADDGLFGFVFSELFANAIDHGILAMSSEIKLRGFEGLSSYMDLRAERLEKLDHGRISVQIEATEFSGKPATRLRIVDSGRGFDQALLLSEEDYLTSVTAGRGFKLVMNTCLKVSYAGSGNDVTVYIPREA